MCLTGPLSLSAAHLETWSAMHEVGYRVACAETLTKCKSIQQELMKHQVNPLMLKKRPATAYVVNILNMITTSLKPPPKNQKKKGYLDHFSTPYRKFKAILQVRK